MEGMIGALQPVHHPVAQDPRCLLHQIAAAQRVARAVEAEHRDFDLRQMRIAQLLRLPRRMQRISEEQQAVAVETVRREHRRRAPAHRAAADDQLAPVARALRHLRDPRLQHRHRIGAVRFLLAIREIETDHLEPARAERIRQRHHPAIVHVAASAVGANQDSWWRH